MRTGIMLPNGIPDRPAHAVAQYAARAESRGFDSIGVIDRIAYDCVDPLITLACWSPRCGTPRRWQPRLPVWICSAADD
jgi:alkanesulfonate monooxygenase SsuD/methylene tetrahydromethanopterin reductase-like flavin-dependent oxidoreductase (luciferase family)